jgi:TP901 family phage tail tape measure protein
MATKREQAIVDLIINGQSANASLRDLEAAARKAKAELRGMLPGTPEFKAAAENVARINGMLEKTRVEAGMTKSAFDKMKDSIKTKFIGILGANVATLGLQKLSSMMLDSIETFKQFQNSLKNLSALTGLQGKDLSFLGEAAQLTSMKTGLAAKDIVEAYKLIASAKPELLSNKEGLAAITQEAIALSRASGLDLPEASKRLTDALNQFGAPASEAGRYVNVLAEAARLSAAEVPDITDSLLQFGVAANSAKIPIEQSSALIEVMAEKGVKGSEAGMKLRNVLIALNSPEVLDKKALEYFEKHGVNLQTLSDKSLSFSDRLKELSKISGDAAAYVSIFGKENSIAAQIITENVSRVNELTTALSKGGLNTAYDQAATNTQTLSNATAKLGATWDTIMTKQGAIGGFLTNLTNYFTKALITLDNLKSTWDLFVSNLTGKDMKQSTAQYVIDFGTLDDGKRKVSDYFKEYDKMTNADFMKSAIDSKAKFIHAMSLEGVELRKATILWETYTKKRTDSMIDGYKNRQTTPVASPDTPTSQVNTIPKDDKSSKQAKKDAEKAEKERLREIQRVYKIEEGLLDDAIKHASDAMKKSFEDLKKSNAEKMKEIQDFYEKETQATVDLAVATAGTDEEKYKAEVDRIKVMYMEKMNAVKEGSAQYKLLEAQLTNDLESLEKERKNKLVSSVQTYTAAASGLMHNYFSYLQAEENARSMAADKKDQAERKSLKNQLDNKIITQAQYDAKLAELDKEKEDRQKQAQRREADRQKEAALFDATIKTLIAWLEAWIDPTKIAGAIGASAELALIAATPVPQFYDGGYTGDGNGNGLDGRGGFKAMLHPNEYVLNAQAMQNPIVQKVTNAIDAGVNPSLAVATSNGAKIGSGGSDELTARLVAVLERMDSNGVKGVWDWDYDKKTRAIISDNTSKRQI